MGKWLITLLMFCAVSASAAPAWTWVDANGQRHYSDVPVPGAVQVELAGAQGFATPQTPTSDRREEPASEQRPSAEYQTFNIVSPAHQETLWNIGTVLNVQVELQPGLQAGHHLDVYLDGERIGIGATSTQFSIPNVFRGLHTVEVAIADSAGTEILRSGAVTVMVQQTSVLNPN
jgi:Domain of unknown function (DUF4124)